jgi:hypothetical protein
MAAALLVEQAQHRRHRCRIGLDHSPVLGELVCLHDAEPTRSRPAAIRLQK